MKRSEMLRHLKGLIRGVHIDDFHKFAEGNMSMGRLVSNIAETALNAVEEKGMRPPKEPEPKSEFSAEEEAVLLHKLEVETRHLDCNCEDCKKMK